MINAVQNKISRILFLFSVALIIYMPLHVFISQSFSMITGGLEVWKAAKDVILLPLVLAALGIAYNRGILKDKFFQKIILLGGAYSLLHLLFILFDRSLDLQSVIIGTVYNTRLFGYFLLGYVVVQTGDKKKYLEVFLSATVAIATIVALFGALQYFLPKDVLTHAGYAVERGVKPMFFIDDKPDLPRVMSTLKDPNSLGAYLILPLLITGCGIVKKSFRKTYLHIRMNRGVLATSGILQFLALVLTFSRGALLGLVLSLVTIFYIVTRNKAWVFVKKHLPYFVAALFIIPYLLFMFRNTYIFQNLIFHADKSTVLEDPNELRVSFTKNVIDDIVTTPFGHGPGTAGLVAIRNPHGGILTENYYLQIAYEVGWLGILFFVATLIIVTKRLWSLSKSGLSEESELPKLIFASLVAYLFYSLLIHLWSNEAVALQWWLIAGVACSVLSVSNKKRA